MKYKKVYEILNKRRFAMKGFSYDDRSCWRERDYTARLTPLWICAEDRSTGHRLWITQTSATAMHISYVKIDVRGKRMGIESHIRCKSKDELVNRLERLFAAWDKAAEDDGEKGEKAA